MKEGSVRRSAGNESEKEENFSPAEKQENQISPSLRDVGFQEAPPTIMMSEAEGYKIQPTGRCHLFSLSSPQSPCNIPYSINNIASFSQPYLQTTETRSSSYLSSERP